MAHNLRERAQWRKEKAPIIRKYIGEHGKLMSEIAGRGFLNLPGYAYDLENEIELMAKMGLSEVNFKILSETIERELKQQGLDYDLSYRSARMAWEIEKQALMAAWDAELAGIKQGMASEEETLTRLAQEVAARQIFIVEAKAAIDLEMEGYRLTLEGLDGQTAPYDVQLANAKVLTAQKKLEVIPVLQQIITKEQELLIREGAKAAEYAILMGIEQSIAAKQADVIPILQQIITKEQELLIREGAKAAEYAILMGIEQNIADKQGEVIPILQEIITKEGELITAEQAKTVEYAALMDARRETALKKQLLLPGYQELASLHHAYASLIPGQIAIETQIAQEKIAQAQAVNTKAENQLEELNADIDAANARIRASEAERDVRDARFDTEQNLIGDDIRQENLYQNLSDAFIAALIAGNQSTQGVIVSNKRTDNTARNEIKEGSTQTITQASMDADAGITVAEVTRIEQVADINAAANITASLKHLIG